MNKFIIFFLILLSAILDICANLSLAKSKGFENIIYLFLALFCVSGTFLILAFVLEFGVALPVAYTLWGAVGILGTTIGGYILFNQRLKPIGIVGVGLTLCAVYLLHFA